MALDNVDIFARKSGIGSLVTPVDRVEEIARVLDTRLVSI